jgi:hypothetical protein
MPEMVIEYLSLPDHERASAAGAYASAVPSARNLGDMCDRLVQSLPKHEAWSSIGAREPLKRDASVSEDLLRIFTVMP